MHHRGFLVLSTNISCSVGTRIIAPQRIPDRCDFPVHGLHLRCGFLDHLEGKDIGEILGDRSKQPADSHATSSNNQVLTNSMAL
jgi:hypothetical protein